MNEKRKEIKHKKNPKYMEVSNPNFYNFLEKTIKKQIISKY